MDYTFNSETAKEVGVDGAVMLKNIHYWVLKNKANNKHFYDDNYWTYNSISAFEDLFPFWSKRQIDRILKNLINNGYLITGNYNKSNYDKTKWYAITKKGHSILPNGEMEFTKLSNRSDQNVKPIPNINTDNKLNSKYTSQDAEDIWSIYPNKKGKTKALCYIAKILKKYSKQELINAVERYSLEIKGVDKQFVLHGSTFFNGRYEDYLDDNYSQSSNQDKNISDDGIREF
ncbi:hypothetical protein [Clostridium sp.]|uniref:hypothetical protein n=1 Tax=Clostridium sp. TaxID=1506 RepID=UPI002911C834|nr:hypothetical protein [Clostridium sp.]MDU4479896.1 hypothetical protein [Clostridium sp.]